MECTYRDPYTDFCHPRPGAHLPILINSNIVDLCTGGGFRVFFYSESVGSGSTVLVEVFSLKKILVCQKHFIMQLLELNF